MKRASARVASSAILSTATKLPASTTIGRQLVSSVRVCSATSSSCFSRGISFSLPSNWSNDDEDKRQPIRVPGCKAIPTTRTKTIITEVPQGTQLSVRSVHSSEASKQDYLLPHPIWKGEYVDAVQVTHREPVTLLDKAAYYSVKLMRFNFDWMSGYSFGRSESKWLSRMMYLETVAGVPGSLAAMIRHLNSLRRVERDHGWIHTLLEEAENERMHLLVALQLKKPSLAFRAAIWVTQGVFANFWFLSYILSPTFCHRFVGYLEEEAVKTYTKMLEDIDHGCLKHWATTPAPEIAKHYWKLPENATMKEVIAIVRADEAHHRQVNHEFSSLKKDQDNPFAPGY